MNSILEKLKLLGFIIKVSYKTGILATLDMEDISYTINVHKDYKGYHVKFTEWISNSFGHTNNFDVTKSKEVCNFINKLKIY